MTDYLNTSQSIESSVLSLFLVNAVVTFITCYIPVLVEIGQAVVS